MCLFISKGFVADGRKKHSSPDLGAEGNKRKSVFVFWLGGLGGAGSVWTKNTKDFQTLLLLEDLAGFAISVSQ